MTGRRRANVHMPLPLGWQYNTSSSNRSARCDNSYVSYRTRPFYFFQDFYTIARWLAYSNSSQGFTDGIRIPAIAAAPGLRANRQSGWPAPSGIGAREANCTQSLPAQAFLHTKGPQQPP